MNFKKWVKSIQTAGYNGARTVPIIFQFHDVVFCSLGFDFIFESVWSYCDNDKAFMSEVIHRLDVIVGEHFKIKTNVGDIEKEIELQSDKIVVVSDLLVKVQKQTTEFHQKTSFGKYIMYLKNT